MYNRTLYFVGCCAGDTELFVWVKVKLPEKSAETSEKCRNVASFSLKNRRLFLPKKMPRLVMHLLH